MAKGKGVAAAILRAKKRQARARKSDKTAAAVDQVDCSGTADGVVAPQDNNIRLGDTVFLKVDRQNAFFVCSIGTCGLGLSRVQLEHTSGKSVVRDRPCQLTAHRRAHQFSHAKSCLAELLQFKLSERETQHSAIDTSHRSTSLYPSLYLSLYPSLYPLLTRGSAGSEGGGAVSARCEQRTVPAVPSRQALSLREAPIPHLAD